MDNVERNILEFSGLELAYLGDCVWELEIRKYYLQYGYNILKLNKKVKEKVNGKFQSEIFRKIYPNLDEEIKNIARRAKNSNIKSFPKSCSILEYREATAFEAIVAVFYLKKENEKIEEILKFVLEGEENEIF